MRVSTCIFTYVHTCALRCSSRSPRGTDCHTDQVRSHCMLTTGMNNVRRRLHANNTTQALSLAVSLWRPSDHYWGTALLGDGKSENLFVWVVQLSRENTVFWNGTINKNLRPIRHCLTLVCGGATRSVAWLSAAYKTVRTGHLCAFMYVLRWQVFTLLVRRGLTCCVCLSTNYDQRHRWQNIITDWDMMKLVTVTGSWLASPANHH